MKSCLLIFLIHKQKTNADDLKYGHLIDMYVVRCAIWYHFYNLKNVKYTHGEVLILQPATLLKLALLHGCFSRFLNCTNSTKLRKVLHMTGI